MRFIWLLCGIAASALALHLFYSLAPRRAEKQEAGALAKVSNLIINQEVLKAISDALAARVPWLAVQRLEISAVKALQRQEPDLYQLYLELDLNTEARCRLFRCVSLPAQVDKARVLLHMKAGEYKISEIDVALRIARLPVISQCVSFLGSVALSAVLRKRKIEHLQPIVKALGLQQQLERPGTAPAPEK